ncbi:hypothetical protein [Brevibacillus marinus]|uniref:hypothetical protein n=1 Tax=Brevibacillus marinus TaxID=2496837 RepID=UPI000F84C9A0|nr:hypothetical protein [Brevibacillus marinus]
MYKKMKQKMVMALAAIMLIGMIGMPMAAFAESSVDLQLNPDTQGLIDTGETITENIVGAVQGLAGFACVILFLIAAIIRAFAGGDQNKIRSAGSFAGWGVLLLAIAFTIDRIVSFILGIFT